MEVSDARLDHRFADNPLVTGEPGIRFYAGAPLELSGGARVGTLCVIDREPRQLVSSQREVLRQLARSAALALESRRTLLLERQIHRGQIQAVRELAQSEARFRALSEHSPLGVYEADALGACTWANARARAIFDMSLNQGRGDGWVRALHPADQPRVHAAWRAAAAQGREFDETFRLLAPTAGLRQVRSRAAPVRDLDGHISGYVGTLEDLTLATAAATADGPADTDLAPSPAPLAG
jgi:PAS domain S-box-containing protein